MPVKEKNETWKSMSMTALQQYVITELRSTPSG